MPNVRSALSSIASCIMGDIISYSNSCDNTKINNTCDNMPELFQFMESMTEDERTLLLTVSPSWKQAMGAILILTLLWGSLMKFFIYFNISNQKISDRPINVLILVDQALHHILNCVVIVSSITKLLGDTTMPELVKSITGLELNDRRFCICYSILAYFMLAYEAVSSAGMGIYRLLYLKATKWVQLKVGERELLVAVLSGGLVIAAGLCLLNGAGTVTGSSTFNGCVGHNERFEEIYFLYMGQPAIGETLPMKLFPLLIIMVQLMEVCCYAVLYRTIYGHQHEMVAIGIISRDTYQTRKQVHIFSISAQVCGLVVKLVFLSIIVLVRLLGRKYFFNNTLEINNTIKITQFGVISTVQILATPDLRHKFREIFRRLFCSLT